MAKRTLAAIPAAVVFAAAAYAGSAVAKYTANLKVQRGMMGMLGKRAGDMNPFIDATQTYTTDETFGAMRSIGRATGNVTPAHLRAAENAELQHGLSADESANSMGSFRRAGYRNGAEVKAFEKTLASGFATGLERQRIGEHLSNVDAGIAAVGENTTGLVDADGINKALVAIGGIKGMQGARGGAVHQKLQGFFQSAASGGMDDERQALALQAMGFGGPGSQVDYFTALKKLDKGANIENVRAIIDGARGRHSGDNAMTAHEVSRMTGISQTVSEELVSAAASGGMDDSTLDAKIQEAINSSKPVDEQILSELKKIANNDRTEQKGGKTLIDEALKLQTTINENIAKLMPLVNDLLTMVNDVLADAEEARKESSFWSAIMPDPEMGKFGRLVKDTADPEAQADALARLRAQEAKVAAAEAELVAYGPSRNNGNGRQGQVGYDPDRGVLMEKVADEKETLEDMNLLVTRQQARQQKENEAERKAGRPVSTSPMALTGVTAAAEADATTRLAEQLAGSLRTAHATAGAPPPEPSGTSGGTSQ
jgi:hypothetical protein